jgi:hypothetical protein
MCLDKNYKILTSKNQKECSVSNSFIKKRNLSTFKIKKKSQNFKRISKRKRKEKKGGGDS